MFTFSMPKAKRNSGSIPSLSWPQTSALKPRRAAEAQMLIEEHLNEIRDARLKHFPGGSHNVSPHGFWVFVGERELFVAFDEFPWFREAAIREIANVQLPSPPHLYWPDLDIDLAVESIEHPEIYPLITKAQPNTYQPSPCQGRRFSPSGRRIKKTRDR
jgi:Protein of unknown function (DUF2442)